jgi:hypothetical protein
MATLVTILGVMNLPAHEPIRIEDIGDAMALVQLLNRNGYVTMLEKASE